MKYTLKIDLMNWVEQSATPNIELVNMSDECLAMLLAEALPRVMAESLDPDLAGRSPEIYIRNLRLGRLGDFSRRIVLKAIEQDEIVGLLIALPDANSIMHIYTLGVLPSHRGRGLGQALVTRFLGLARQNGWVEVLLDVHAENLPALKLYKQFGFSEDHSIHTVVLPARKD